MDSADVEKIMKIEKELKAAHDFLSGRSKAYDAFVRLAKESFACGALDPKTKELMAVAISLVIHCEPCLVRHVGEALRAGARDEEIVESIGVAIEMGGGPAVVSSVFAVKVLEYFRDKHKGHSC